ncbi:MAG: response regulator [Verrucomicrobiota bacterium]
MKKKILVVDDDADMIELLSFHLKQAGFAVGTAMNGIEALKKIRSIAPDLVLLDLILPEMDGLAVCETLRRDRTTASLPVIMLTGLSGELSRLSALESGADDYLSKPFSPKTLVSKVADYLHKRDKLRLS